MFFDWLVLVYAIGIGIRALVLLRDDKEYAIQAALCVMVITGYIRLMLN